MEVAYYHLFLHRIFIRCWSAPSTGLRARVRTGQDCGHSRVPQQRSHFLSSGQLHRNLRTVQDGSCPRDFWRGQCGSRLPDHGTGLADSPQVKRVVRLYGSGQHRTLAPSEHLLPSNSCNCPPSPQLSPCSGTRLGIRQHCAPQIAALYFWRDRCISEHSSEPLTLL